MQTLVKWGRLGATAVEASQPSLLVIRFSASQMIIAWHLNHSSIKHHINYLYMEWNVRGVQSRNMKGEKKKGS